MLTVRIGRHASQRVGNVLRNVFESGLEGSSFAFIGAVCDKLSAVNLYEFFSLGEDLVILRPASVVNDYDGTKACGIQVIKQRNEPFVRLIRRYYDRHCLRHFVHMRTYYHKFL